MTPTPIKSSRLEAAAGKRVSEYLANYTAKANISAEELADRARCPISTKTLLALLNVEMIPARRWRRDYAEQLVGYVTRKTYFNFLETWRYLVYGDPAPTAFINEAPYVEYWQLGHRGASDLDAHLVRAAQKSNPVICFGRIPLFGLIPDELLPAFVAGYCDPPKLDTRNMREGLKRLERLRAQWIVSVKDTTPVQYFMPQRDSRKMCSRLPPFQYFSEADMQAFINLLCFRIRENDFEFGLLPSTAHQDPEYSWLLSQTFAMGIGQFHLLRHNYGKSYFNVVDAQRNEITRRVVARRTTTLASLSNRVLHASSPAAAIAAVEVLAADVAAFPPHLLSLDEAEERRSDAWLPRQLKLPIT